MLVWLLDWLAGAQGDLPQALDAVAKTTFRGSVAALLSFALALALGPRLIAWLRIRFREPNRSPSDRLRELHAQKEWTPTMGGLFIVAGITVALLLLADLSNGYVQVALLVLVGLALVGAVDDLRKLRGDARGLSPRGKLIGQLLVAMPAVCWLYRLHATVPGTLELSLPLGLPSIALGWLLIPWGVLVLVGMSNAVNLTDGLDGLAGGCLIFATGALAVMAFAAGHAELARYLNVVPIAGGNEMLVVAAAMIGAVLGFLWFNCHPAQVFMGDTGSLPLGGLLGLVALVIRQELLLLIVGGVFVVEASSVALQVAAFRLTGRRIFRCAPLHHHFQFAGWPESKVVVRFWIAAALCAVTGLAGLKLTVRDDRPREVLRLAERYTGTGAASSSDDAAWEGEQETGRGNE